MRKKLAVTAASALLLLAVASSATANHVVVDPNAVPAGFLAAHNDVANIEIDSFPRVVRNGHADAFIRHFVFAAGSAPLAWHTHPGPAIVTVASGTFAYQDSKGGECRTTWYSAGQGFFDPGLGHVHRGIPGPDGAQLYTLWLTPSGTPNETIPAPAPEACASST
jgi:redox-sensitive bicupin YhaK (pirin superfamily)